MKKKIMCFTLCFLMAVILASPTFAQIESGGLKLHASYVKFSATDSGEALRTFPASGTSVFASTEVTNSGTVAKAAVLWAGVYKNRVLVDIEYQRRVIPAGETYSFHTQGLVIPTGAISDNTEIKAYVWDSFTGGNAIVNVATMFKDDGQLRNICIDGVLLSGFANSKTNYNYTVPLTVSKFPVITAQASDNATEVEISPYVLPGVATIKTTTSNGAVTTYYTVNMIFAAGNVTNVVTKFNSSSPAVQRDTAVSNALLYAVKGSIGVPSTNYSTGTNDDRIASAKAANPYFTGDTRAWSFGDRAANYAFSGSASSAYFQNSGFTLLDTTSPILLGDHVTKILTFNDEKNFTPAIPDVYSFNVDRAVTVYTVTGSAKANFDTNFVNNNAWTKETGIQAFRGSTVILTGSDSKYYAVPSGSTSLGNVYSKHFEAGTVNVPSRGAADGAGMILFVLWDAPNGIDNANVSAISYKMPGEMVYQNIENVAGTILNYTVRMPAGLATLPALNVTSEDPRATVKLEMPTTSTGSAAQAKITITSLSGKVSNIYTVNFTTD